MKGSVLRASASSALALMIVLAGCSSAPAPEQARDAAPDGAFDVSSVPDAKPHAVGRVKNAPYTVRGKHYEPLATAEGYREIGLASWYGTKFHGKATANGETYNLYTMSAAHKTLPLPCFVRVTNLDNGRDVVVRVNDRGPFHDDRIIDLSWAAATKLGFADKGVARVKIEAISTEGLDAPVKQVLEPDLPAWLQVAALGSSANAKALKTRLQSLTEQPVVIVSGGDVHRVRLGPLTSHAELKQARQMLAQQKLGQGRLIASD